MCKQSFEHVNLNWSGLKYQTQYFSSVINLNKQRSNETLVGAVIQTSDLWDGERVCYQLSHAKFLCDDFLNLNFPQPRLAILLLAGVF